MIRGTIVRGMGGVYTARDADGNEYTLRAKKKFRRLHMSPLVGDEIWLTKGEISDEHGWIEEILPRTSQCFRPPVANATLLAVILAAEPKPDLLLIDKLLVLARRDGLRCVLIVNKDDLDSEPAHLIQRQYEKADVPVFVVSALEGTGVEALKACLRGQTVCFSGQSGVGKSSLLNALLGLNVETGCISRKILRGKNTTRHAELFEHDGIRVLDTPGFSLLTLDEEPIDPVLLQEDYPEFVPYAGQCRFQPCYHLKEPGCAVLEAVKQGRISSERLERYHILLDETREAWRKRYD